MRNKTITRLELAIQKIDQIFEICKPKGVTEALKDELLKKPAIMKHIEVSNLKNLKKIKNTFCLVNLINKI